MYIATTKYGEQFKMTYDENNIYLKRLDNEKEKYTLMKRVFNESDYFTVTKGEK